MSELPYQRWFEDTFASDPFVRTLSWAEQNGWRCVLQKMWLNHGWLPADDVICARQLGCDVRTWRVLKRRLSPRLRVEVDPVVGSILRQHRVSKDWDEAVERKDKFKQRSAHAAAERSRKAKERRTLKVVGGKDLEGHPEDRLEDRTPALARTPSPSTPSPKDGDGDGVPLTPATASPAQPPGAAEPAVAASELAGPFVPAAKPPARPITPAGRSSFLERWERHQAGDEHALDPTPGAPRLSEPVGDPGLWDTVNSKFKPERPALAAKEGPADERQPSDDDLDDFIKF